MIIWGTLKLDLISSRRIIFTPSVDLKDELANAAIQITCIDRNGKEVKRVTSTSGEVEDPENENGGTTDSGNNGSTENGGGNQNGGGDNGGGNSGGGDTPGGNGGDDED